MYPGGDGGERALRVRDARNGVRMNGDSCEYDGFGPSLRSETPEGRN
jgi:hypothetical protein